MKPKTVEFIDALPKGPTGKILKRELRDPWWEGRQSRLASAASLRVHTADLGLPPAEAAAGS